MSVLTVISGDLRQQLPFSGQPPLKQVLQQAGLLPEQPCGGRGTCGKCAVELEGAVSAPNAAEQTSGVRLCCQAVLLGDAVVRLKQTPVLTQIETGGKQVFRAPAPMTGVYGAAVDLGTTTVALKLCRLSDGAILASAACANPQRSTAADVIGRIEAAMAGHLPQLQRQILSAVELLLAQACQSAGIEPEAVESLVLTGNTTMLYLLTGRNPVSLSAAPFQADCLFGLKTGILGRHAFLPACLHAFVGADLTCAVLASGMTEAKGPALLCDLGTNGELALWNNGTLYVTSTAAGPAFEGAGISCGCLSIPGAIDRVWLEHGTLHCHTIGEADAVGVCGSGLLDAVAVLLQTGAVDETGAAEAKDLVLTETVALEPKDIRAVQLAKAAIAAGIQILLAEAGVSEQALTHVWICGGFGAHLNLQSAAAIGLLPPTLTEKAQVLGNAALTGAVELLLDTRLHNSASMAVRHVDLGGNPKFNETYIDQMFFPET